jgi:hypothetical protein
LKRGGSGEKGMSMRPSEKRLKLPLVNSKAFCSPTERINDISPWQRDFQV